MPEYRYKAVTTEGETISGQLTAADEAGAVAELIRLGHYPVETRLLRGTARHTAAKQTVAGGGVRLATLRALLSKRIGGAPERLTGRGLTDFTRDLAHMTRAGLTVDQALHVLNQTTQNLAVRATIETITRHIRDGASLSVALERHGKPFDALYTALVSAGETAGALPAVLDRLASYLKRMAELKNSVTVALIYPSALLTATILSVTVLMTTVVPRFEALFLRAGAELPVATQVVMGLSRTVAGSWWIAVLAGFLAWTLGARAMRTKAIRRRVHGLLLTLPVAGMLMRKIDLARFSRALGLMLDNGVSMLTAYRHALSVIGNARLSADLEALTEPLRAGQGLAGPLIATGTFPGAGAQLVKVGEETGRLGPMLLEIADLYDGEVETGIKRALALLEPIIILTLGLLVGGIVLSLFTAMTGLQDVAL